MTSTLIENLVERVAQKHSVSPHILFDEIALNLNERFHNYHVVDSLDEIDWAFCSEHFMYESFRERVTVEEKLHDSEYEINLRHPWYNKIFKTK